MSAVEEFLAYERGIEKDAAAPPGFGGMLAGVKEVFGLTPKVVAERGAAIAQAAPKQPFDELLKQTMRGTAAVGLAGAATGAALGTAEKLWDLASSTISKVHGFHTMMQANPELDKMDRQKVHTVYSTLHRFNPEMAKDPFVSGAWVKKLTEYDYVDPKTVGDLISARSKSTGDSFFQRGVQLAQQGSQFGALDAAKVYAQEQAKRQVAAAYQDTDAANAAMTEAMKQYGKDVGSALTAPTPEEEQEKIRNTALWQAQGKGEYEASPEARDVAFQGAFNRAAGGGAYEESTRAMQAAGRKAMYQERGKQRA